MAATLITGVWNDNFHKEIAKLDAALLNYPIVSIDTEFPGFLRNTSRDATEEERYRDLKYSIDGMRLIQVGVTVSDGSGNIGGTWEFNLCFDLEKQLFVYDSVEFLKSNGMNFEKMRRDGIDSCTFSRVFGHIVRKHQHLCWVTFHGLYDLAHLLKLVTNKATPGSASGFVSSLGAVFGHVVDIKYMARVCKGLRDGELGLAAIAKILKVVRVGGAHQAGSDSLLTARVYAKMRNVYQIEESAYMGCLYGISARISKTVMLPTVRRYCNPYPFTSTLVPFQCRVPLPHGIGGMYVVPF